MTVNRTAAPVGRDAHEVTVVHTGERLVGDHLVAFGHLIDDLDGEIVERRANMSKIVFTSTGPPGAFGNIGVRFTRSGETTSYSTPRSFSPWRRLTDRQAHPQVRDGGEPDQQLREPYGRADPASVPRG